MHVFKNNQIVFTGYRNKRDGLWDVPLPQQQQYMLHMTHNLPKEKEFDIDYPMSPLFENLNVIIRKDKTKNELIRYLHACCFSPQVSTFIKAISNGNFLSWPGLTEKLARKFLEPSIATAKGHLDKERKNLQSTRLTTQDEEKDFFPEPENPNLKTHEICAMLFPFSSKELAYADLTGRFPYRSTRGNQYILVIYDYDSNVILAEPLKSRVAREIKRGFLKLNETLARRGCQPKIYILDNEASNELKNSLLKYDIKYQLVPPHIHRRNAAECAIRTFKNHFSAGIATLDPKFPICEWDRLLPQAILTLNLLRNSRVNPKLSAWAYLHGNYDFNK